MINMYKPDSHADYSRSLAVSVMQPVSASANVTRRHCIEVFLAFMFSVNVLHSMVPTHLDDVYFEFVK